MARFGLTDGQWQRLAPLLPPQHSGKRGRPYVDHRRVVNGILWVLHTGAPWADVPERYGPHQTAYDRYVRWRKQGVWDRVLHALQAQADADGRLSWAYAAVDATIIAVHPNAATRGVYAAPDALACAASDVAQAATCEEARAAEAKKGRCSARASGKRTCRAVGRKHRSQLGRLDHQDTSGGRRAGTSPRLCVVVWAAP